MSAEKESASTAAPRVSVTKLPVRLIDPAADYVYRQELEAFTKAMLDKAYHRYQTRRMDGTELRRMDPWNHDIAFLSNRLQQEWNEFWESEGNPDELLDIANFCFYLWMRISSLQSNPVDKKAIK